MITYEEIYGFRDSDLEELDAKARRDLVLAKGGLAAAVDVMNDKYGLKKVDPLSIEAISKVIEPEGFTVHGLRAWHKD